MQTNRKAHNKISFVVVSKVRIPDDEFESIEVKSDILLDNVLGYRGATVPGVVGVLGTPSSRRLNLSATC